MAPDRLPGDGAQDRTVALRHRHLDAPPEGVVGVLAWRLGREVGIEHGLEGDPFGPALSQRPPQRRRTTPRSLSDTASTALMASTCSVIPTATPAARNCSTKPLTMSTTVRFWRLGGRLGAGTVEAAS